MTNSKSLKALALGAAVSAALSSSVASASDLTANAAIASNYIWRGVTQTADQAAGQGGIDWGFGPGFYVGTWVSNVDFSDIGDGVYGKNYEMDVYAGWGGETGDFGYDLGVITYQYPVEPQINFTELYVSGSYKVLTLALNYTVDAASGHNPETNPNSLGIIAEGDLYAFAGLDFETKVGDFSLYAGSYMFDNDGKDFSATGGATVGAIDYVHYGASWGKGDFTFSVDKNDIEDPVLDKVRFTVMWSKDFELM